MRYFVESYGCTMNYGEGGRLSEDMSAMGHEAVPCAESADIVILNTCTVVDTTEKKMIRRMSELRKAGKEVVVTGCMAKVQANRIMIRLPDPLIIPPDRYSEFSAEIEERYGRGGCCETGTHLTNILPIAQGCLGDCTYCITKLARGRLSSYDPDILVSKFDSIIADGAKEILITAQDTGCYGADIGTDLPSLLGRMLESDAEFRIRIGMMNPDSLMPIADRLMGIMKDPRVYKFLHIPVQSGSDAVLKRMNRSYSAGDFLGLVEKVRSGCPGLSISTDLMSGFPGETDKDHRMSLGLVEALKADTVNITRFSPRPGTEAALMESVHGRISKDRSAELTETKNRVEYENNRMVVGRVEKALITETGKESTMIARTDNYRPVAVPSRLPVGSFVSVEITGCEPTYLLGRVLDSRR
ncbi:MAG: tRNA (N(6)-L-threonylcarbamoyladenosine(37)-C(2))-methylthiotransferase [Candidatus Methanoplasma sp.]|jgi:MiaB-like tRNA modifying enzyme|nr:tRNA (N(6)-L-threonylcarbamoyladenosine(37)-C(2))-methylthiotransferase [Candidatus Methanoplasma sp.]